MNKSLVSLSITLSLLFSSNVLSEGFNDNYLKFGSGVNGFSPLHSQLRDEIAKNRLVMGIMTQMQYQAQLKNTTQKK